MTVSFEEARAFWEVHLRDVDAALKRSAREARVASKSIDELNSLREQYVARLGDQPDPYVAFRDRYLSRWVRPVGVRPRVGARQLVAD